MEKNDTLNNIQNAVKNAPLASILEAAEGVACVVGIPGLPIIIKILKMLIKLQPAANGVMDAAVQTKNVKQNEEKMSRQEAREILEEMIDIATEDGVITPDEEAFLRKKAVAAGVDPEDLMFKVYHKCKQYSITN